VVNGYDNFHIPLEYGERHFQAAGGGTNAEIDEAMKRMDAGEFYTHDDARFLRIFLSCPGSSIVFECPTSDNGLYTANKRLKCETQCFRGKNISCP
jgi:hypothetical protein